MQLSASGILVTCFPKKRLVKDTPVFFLTVCICLTLQGIYGKSIVKYVRKITVCTGVKCQVPRTELSIPLMQAAVE